MVDSHFHPFEFGKTSVIRQKGKSQNGCFKKTKHVKFSEKETFFTPLIRLFFGKYTDKNEYLKFLWAFLVKVTRVFVVDLKPWVKRTPYLLKWVMKIVFCNEKSFSVLINQLVSI